MAFNFNWSPLIADTSRARDMLTAALNKSPKPPIIVDDIIVTELNLGRVPPELEILEIGDLAEDRFRGIFKMSYSGDAFLTLSTRVQANPLNTYLTSKPSFASPAPLAAASGLTIPLQLTLSDIRLSGFVILVFSRQKGLTLVFRNDPLESLKVSSTFDSIPFVRDYLQKEIEAQLRVLFVDDLPAILHRLSLRLWSHEYRELDDQASAQATASSTTGERGEGDSAAHVDALARAPQDPVDALGNPIDLTPSASLSFDPNAETSSSETHASFSQKNLLRLATLTSSHHTLSLFTPPVRDAVFRAWASPAVTAVGLPHDSYLHHPQHHSLTLASLSRMQSYTASTSPSAPTSTASIISADARTSADSGSVNGATRPALLSYNSFSTTTSSYARAHARTRKRRIVNLRRGTDIGGNDAGTAPPNPIPEDAASAKAATAVESASIPESDAYVASDPGPGLEARLQMWAEEKREKEKETVTTAAGQGHAKLEAPADPHLTSTRDEKRPFPIRQTSFSAFPEKGARRFSPTSAASSSYANLHRAVSPASRAQSPPQLTGSILEQAWLVKMAAEMAQRAAREGGPAGGSAAGFWERVADGSRFGSAGIGGGEVVDEAPPAYVE